MKAESSQCPDNRGDNATNAESVLSEHQEAQNGDLRPDERSLLDLVAKVQFPTRFGMFDLYGFNDPKEKELHTVLVKGDVKGALACPVRIHSECHTGDVLGSLRCDCREQLESAMHYISQQQRGVIVYLRQEGRGIGLLNKLKAYSLQDGGLDTVEANEFLGFPAEARDYKAAAEIVRRLQIESIVLLTNNPDKMKKLKELGVDIVRRRSIVTPANEYNRYYLATKKDRMGHLY